MRPAVFLDRDGTIIREVGYLTKIAQIEIYPSAFEAVRLLNQRGIPAVVVTNQSGIARGYLNEARLNAIHERIDSLFLAEEASLEAFYFCPHHPGVGDGPYGIECSCRKPNPGLLERAAREMDIDLSRSIMIGDTLSDVGAGKRAGCAAVLVRTGYGQEAVSRLGQPSADQDQPDYVASDILAAVLWALERLHERLSGQDR